MLSAAALAVTLAGGRAWAAAPPPAGCAERLAGALAAGSDARLQGCFDAAGQARWDEVRREPLAFDGPARLVELPELTILSALVDESRPGLRRVLVAEGAPPWRGIDAFWAERGWPAGELDAKAPPSTRAQLDAVLAAFNARFGRGDAAGWLSFWAPDAVFYSFAGPYRGAGIAEFFEHQRRRYARPRMTAASVRPGPTPDSFVVLQRLQGVCRATGGRFEMPMLLLLALRGGKVRLAYEAFGADGDGCGPF